jgi:molecular chaperone IbpA
MTTNQPAQKVKVQLPAQHPQAPTRWTSSPIRALMPKLVGFDEFFDIMDKALTGETVVKADNYPPRNIVKLDENRWEIQFAVSGFSKEDLKISVKQNTLTVKGSAKPDDFQNGETYLFHGIGYRDFEHSVTFPENSIISPTLKDGMLKILIEKPIAIADNHHIIEIQ